MEFQEILSNEAYIQPRSDFVKQVKWPFLLTHLNQTYTVLWACRESATYGDSGKSLEWNPRYSQEGTLFPKLSAVYY